MSVLKDFEKKFDAEIFDMLVLTKESVYGAACEKNMLKPSVDFVASVNLDTDEFSQEKGRLEWLIENTPDRKGWGYNFKEFQIYHMKVRKNIPIELEPYMSKTVNNCYMVVDLVEENVSEPRLDAIKEHLVKPVIIEDKTLGTFQLNRHFSWFEGSINWLEKKCDVSLYTDEEDGETAEKSFAVLRKLYENLQDWDDKFRKYAAEELTELANEWYDDDDESKYEDEDFDEDEDEIFITEEDFIKRISIGELVISADGNLTLYYNDDDMFYGHTIEIDANINGEIRSADIAG